MTAVTPVPWSPNLQHAMYGTTDTYQRAADWLKDCRSVADWGGGFGHLGAYLPPSVGYRVVDGTIQATEQTLADLRTFHEPSDGILLRHVLDLNLEWRGILENALLAFRRRMVVVTFTPDAEQTGLVKLKSGWPIVHFNPVDLRYAMAPWLVHDEAVVTSHPERIYYLERR